MTFYIICFFIFGTVMGSFYNVLGSRIPKGESIIRPASHCERCGHILKWYELIPIFSYMFLKGRCHNCREKLSILYPLSELLCGILFSLSYYSFGFSPNLLISLTISSFFIMVLVSDITYMIIPNRFTIICSLIIIFVKILGINLQEGLLSIGYGFLSFIIMYAIMYLGNIFFQKECLGGGDVKLMFLVGLTVGALNSLLVIILASFIALPTSLIIYFQNKEHAIPFGPFLVIGLLIMFFTKLSFIEILNWF